MARGGEPSSSKSLQVPEQRPRALPIRLIRTIFNRGNLIGALLGAAPPLLLGYGSAGAVAGFFAVRWVYSKTEQRGEVGSCVLPAPHVTSVCAVHSRRAGGVYQKAPAHAACLPAHHANGTLLFSQSTVAWTYA